MADTSDTYKYTDPKTEIGDDNEPQFVQPDDPKPEQHDEHVDSSDTDSSEPLIDHENQPNEDIGRPNLAVNSTRCISVRKVCKDNCFRVFLASFIISLIGIIALILAGFIHHIPLGPPYTKIETSTQTKSFNANNIVWPGVELYYAVYIGTIKGYERSKVSVTTDYDFRSDNITIVLSKKLKKNKTLTKIDQTLDKPLREQYAAGEFNYTVDLTGTVGSIININVSLNDHVICSSSFQVTDSSLIPFNCTSNKIGYYGFDYSGNGTQNGVLTYEVLDVEYYNKMVTSLACVMNITSSTCLIQLSSKNQGIYHIIAMLPPYHVKMDFKIDEGRSTAFSLLIGLTIAFIILKIICLILLSCRVKKVFLRQ